MYAKKLRASPGHACLRGFLLDCFRLLGWVPFRFLFGSSARVAFSVGSLVWVFTRRYPSMTR